MLILLVDCQLMEADARVAIQTLQPNVDKATWANTWQSTAAAAQRPGDVLFCKGANASPFDIPIGASSGATLGTRTLGLVQTPHQRNWRTFKNLVISNENA